MARDGYLRVRAGGVIRLTPKGRAIADKLVLRHRLAEKLLNEVIGVEWSKVHEEAERLEHGISDEVAELLLKRFGPDTTCPHGVPLRGGMAKLRRNSCAVRLSEAQPGDRLEVLRVYEKDPKFLEFIERRRLRPRARVRVLRRDYDETMTLAVGGRRVYLGQPATSRIWVRRISV
jgi:DtxR family Mn-dependent transcriptional regulator